MMGEIIDCQEPWPEDDTEDRWLSQVPPPSLPPLHSFLLRWKLSPTSAPPADCGWDPSSPSGPSSTWVRGITQYTFLSSITWQFSSEDDLGDLDVTVTTRPEQSEPMQMPGGLTLPSSVFLSFKQTLQVGQTLCRSRQSS